MGFGRVDATSPSTRRRRRGFAVPVVGVGVGVFLVSGGGGRPRSGVSADAPQVSTTYLHFHQYPNNGTAAANAQGSPWAVVQNSVVHSHTYTNDGSTAANAQGPPWATRTLVTVDHAHPYSHVHYADHWHGGTHDHYDNFHTNKYRKWKNNVGWVSDNLYCSSTSYNNCNDFNCWGYDCGSHNNYAIDSTYTWKWWEHWDSGQIVREQHAHKYASDGDCPPDTCFTHVHTYLNDGSYGAALQGSPYATLHSHTAYTDSPPATSHTHTYTNDGSSAANAQGSPWAYYVTTAASHTHTSTIGVWHTHQDTVSPRPS